MLKQGRRNAEPFDALQDCCARACSTYRMGSNKRRRGLQPRAELRIQPLSHECAYHQVRSHDDHVVQRTLGHVMDAFGVAPILDVARGPDRVQNDLFLRLSQRESQQDFEAVG